MNIQISLIRDWEKPREIHEVVQDKELIMYNHSFYNWQPHSAFDQLL